MMCYECQAKFIHSLVSGPDTDIISGRIEDREIHIAVHIDRQDICEGLRSILFFEDVDRTDGAAGEKEDSEQRGGQHLHYGRFVLFP